MGGWALTLPPSLPETPHLLWNWDGSSKDPGKQGTVTAPADLDLKVPEDPADMLQGSPSSPVGNQEQ